MTFIIVLVLLVVTALLVAFSILPALGRLASGSHRLERKAGKDDPTQD